MNGDNEPKNNQPTPEPTTSPGIPQIESAAPPASATNEQLQAAEDKIDKRMSDFERSTIQLTRVAVGVAVVAALFNCLQWLAMRETLDDMKTSGNTSSNQLWQAIGNMNWMARTADGSLQQAQESTRTNKRQSLKSLNATIEQSRLEQRAWVGIDNWVLEKFEVGAPVVLKVRVMNKGRTPAVDVRAGGTAGRIVSNDHTPAQVADILKEEFNKITLVQMPTISPQNGEEFIEDEVGNLDTSRFNAVSSGVSTWYAVGRVTYKDVFHRDQWFTYCLRLEFTNKNPSITYCDTNNDMSH